MKKVLSVTAQDPLQHPYYEKNETRRTGSTKTVRRLHHLHSSCPLARKWRLGTKVDAMPCGRVPGSLRTPLGWGVDDTGSEEDDGLATWPDS